MIKLSATDWLGTIGAKMLQGLGLIPKEEPTNPTNMPTETTPVLITGDEVRN